MRLPSRRIVLAGLLTGLVLVAGCTSLLSDDESQDLIENERESSYSVTVFQSAHETPENLPTLPRGTVARDSFGERNYGPRRTTPTSLSTTRSVRTVCRPFRMATVRCLSTIGTKARRLFTWSKHTKMNCWRFTSCSVVSTWHSRSRPRRTGSLEPLHAAFRMSTGDYHAQVATA